MRAIEWQIKLLLVILCFASHSYAQPSPRVFYHWVARDKVYCWRSLADPKPVVATAVEGGWALSPESVRTDRDWLSVLKTKVSADTPSLKIWSAFLKKLQQEQPNNELAAIRIPDAHLYLRYQTPNSVIVTYIKTQKADAVNFIKDAQGWRPDNVASLSKLSLTAAEMKSVFGSEQAPTSVQTTSAAWAKWITAFLENKSNINPVMSQEAGDMPVWIWQERLLETDWNRRLTLPRTSEQQQLVAPSTTAGVSNQTTQNQGPGQPPFYKEWWFIVITLPAIIFALSFILWKFPRTSIMISRTWKAVSHIKIRRQGKPTQREIAKLTSLRKSVHTQDNRQWEDVYSEYAEAANKSVDEFLEKVRAHVEAQNVQVLQEYGLTELSPQSVKDLIGLGQEVETCYAALIQAQRIGVNSSRFNLYPGSRTKTQWLADLKQLIPSAATEIKEQEDSLQNLVTITEERNSLKQELDNAQERLKNSQKKSAGARATVRERTVKFSTELEQERKRSADLQELVNEIGDSVTSYAGYMQQGLRYYLDETQDTPSAMAVSSLTNHSLYKLCIGITSQDDILRDAMLVNLYSIASKCSHLNGFKLAVEELTKRFPGIEDRQNQLTRSDKTHFNDTLFQKFLLHIRNSSRLELAPFYFDVDKDKKVHYAS